MLRVRSVRFRSGPAHRAAFDAGGASFTLRAILQHRPFKTMQDIIHAQCKQGKNIQRSAQMLNRARWFPAETRGGKSALAAAV